MAQHFGEQRRFHFAQHHVVQILDLVIVDAPPVGLTADARLLTKMVDGSLFVVRAGSTQYDDVQKSVEALGRDQILGIVLNAVEEDQSGGYYYYQAAPAAGTER